MDLRILTFRNVESFSSAVTAKLDSWFTKLKSLPEIEGKLKVSDDVQVTASFKWSQAPLEGLRDMYTSLSRALPTWSWLRGYGIPPPIFIDKANCLEALLDDKRGSTVLNDFFAWLVENTKQMNRFHLIMASSDSFFLKWITQFVDSGSFTNLVIGHLSKEDARRYWAEELAKKDCTNLVQLHFEEPYEICGGCIHLLAEKGEWYMV